MAVAKRELTEKEWAAEAAWIKKLAESADVEPEEVKGKIAERFAEYADLKELKGKPASFILQRVRNRVTGDFKGLANLDTFHGYIDGPSGLERDWNASKMAEIQDTAKTPDAVLAMAKPTMEEKVIEGKATKVEVPSKIITVTEIIDGKPVEKPVRKLLRPMHKDKDGTWHVVHEVKEGGKMLKAYELWEKAGDPVVPRDTSEFLGDGKTENFNFGGELKPNWGVNLSATFFLRKEANEYCPRRANIQVYGELADPANKDNIVKDLEARGLFGVPVMFKGALNTDKTTEGQFLISVRRKYVCQPLKDVPEGMTLGASIDAWTGQPEYSGDPFDAFEGGVPGKLVKGGDSLLGESFDKGMRAVYKVGTTERVDMLFMKAEEANEKAKKAGKAPPYAIKLLPFATVTMGTLREWHEKFQMTTNDFKVIKRKTADESGDFQVKNRARYAVLECSGQPAEAPAEGQSIRLVIMDSADPDTKMSVFLPRHITSVGFTGLADLKLVMQTRKKDTYWDKEANDNLEDGDGRFGDIQLDVAAMMVTFVHPEEENDVPGTGGIEKKVNVPAPAERPDV
jgi:hypothetical protein